MRAVARDVGRLRIGSSRAGWQGPDRAFLSRVREGGQLRSRCSVLGSGVPGVAGRRGRGNAAEAHGQSERPGGSAGCCDARGRLALWPGVLMPGWTLLEWSRARRGAGAALGQVLAPWGNAG
jgi:hypothetical protein